MTQNQSKKQLRKTSLSRKPAAAGKVPVARKNLGLLWLSIGLVLLAVGVLGILYLSGQLGQKPSAVAEFPLQIDVQEAYDLYQQDVFLLDVRTQAEWDEMHVPNATLIPLDELESRLSELPRDGDIVVMCRTGNRSQTGRDILLNAGFENVTSIRGGIVDWQAAGFPTVP